MDSESLSVWLEKLAESPLLPRLLGLSRRGAPVRNNYYWMAYHAVVRERLGDAKPLARVAAAWSRSERTVQDALTDNRAKASHYLDDDVVFGECAGFSTKEVLESLHSQLVKRAKLETTARRKKSR